MTCIIGVEHKGIIYIGGDSLGTNGWMGRTLSNRKVFRVGEFLIGCAGSVRLVQLIQYHLSVRAQEENESDEHYIVVGFVDALRKCLKDYGFATVENGKEEFNYSQFILGYRGQLYQIQGEYNVCCHPDGIEVIGSGSEFAFGAISALLESELPDALNVEQIILRSLVISAKYNRAVAGPFYVEKLP